MALISTSSVPTEPAGAGGGAGVALWFELQAAATTRQTATPTTRRMAGAVRAGTPWVRSDDAELMGKRSSVRGVRSGGRHVMASRTPAAGIPGFLGGTLARSGVPLQNAARPERRLRRA